MATHTDFLLDLGRLTLRIGDGCLFELFFEGCLPVTVRAPKFEVNGVSRGDFYFDGIIEKENLPGGGKETTLLFTTRDEPLLDLRMFIRSFPNSSILRFKYALTTPPENPPAVMTRAAGKNSVQYFEMELMPETRLTEFQLSHFNPMLHAYQPLRLDYRPEEMTPGMSFTGPIALFHASQQTLMAAYEHGADEPQSFLEFHINDGSRISLNAVKGNVFHGQEISFEKAWESIWFELGLQAGTVEDFLHAYRRFFLEEISVNRQSRQPYIFYNTWNYQERQRYFKGRPYLESMTAERILAEIDAAHRLGVEVFVIDTGWYVKTGDWMVNRERFPEKLREVKRRLDGYGMKLGLWFNPLLAALTSEVFMTHAEYEMTNGGKPAWRGPVWETEESAAMCLASDFADYFVQVMLRLNQELGVVYFKWDGIQQYGCDSPLHRHGTDGNTPEERAECYAFQMGQAMIHIVDQVSKECPDVIVDFDVTEGGRFVGLGFLSAGKYFLVNNGPYFHDFDLPQNIKIDPDTINAFFYPGPARARICRSGARYDELIPSILFLTHYLPDGPQLSQRNNVASLVLGGNGWWGDLPALGEADFSSLSEQIALYKQVRQSATRAYPHRQGFAGSSPEIYEKIDPETCCGLMVIFTVAPGTITTCTQPLDPTKLGKVVGADTCEVLADHRLKISVNLERDDARIVFILPK